MLAWSVDLHLPEVRSLKAKRAVVKPITEGIRRRYAASVSEVAFQDTWQRARIGVAVVASSEHQAGEIVDAVERFVWSHPEVQVLDSRRSWLDVEG